MTIQAPVQDDRDVILSDSEESDIFNSVSRSFTPPDGSVQDDNSGSVQDDRDVIPAAAP